MLVHRFIGMSEIEALVNEGFVEPLEENVNRWRCRQKCLFFFDSDKHECPSYQLEYLSGVVGEIYSHKRKERYFCLVLCDIPEERFENKCESYADPEGGWFDTICVDELHLFGEYRKESIKSVTIYTDHYFGFIEHSSYNTIDDAYRFLKEQDCIL